MKKWGILFLIAALCAAVPALGETRTETLSIGGLEESVETEYFESSRGYSIWIDKAHLTLGEAVSGDEVDRFTGADDFSMEIYFGGGEDATLEQIGNDTLDMLLSSYGQVEEIDASALFPGFSTLGFAAPSGELRVEYYLVEVEGSAFHFQLIYNAEQAEGLVTRVHAMLKSFTPLAVESVG